MSRPDRDRLDGDEIGLLLEDGHAVGWSLRGWVVRDPGIEERVLLFHDRRRLRRGKGLDPRGVALLRRRLAGHPAATVAAMSSHQRLEFEARIRAHDRDI